jgi:hypothetical protein
MSEGVIKNMTRREFSKLYTKSVQPQIKGFNEQRKIIYVRLAWAIFLGIIIDIILFILLCDNLPEDFLQWALIIIGALIALFCTKLALKLRSDFKRKMIKPVIEQAFPGSKYSPVSHFSQSEFNSLKLFRGANRFSSEDEISGVLDKTKFRMFELNARHVSGSGKNKRDVTVFKGFIYKMSFHKDFSSHTIVKPDLAEKFLGKYFGNFVQTVATGGFELIKLEDPAFEKHYKVLSTSQQDSRYILSPKIMDRILKIDKMINTKISLSFLYNHLYIAVPRDKNYFEPSMFGEFASYKDFCEIYILLEQIGKIIEDLDLNTRIWSKK